MQRQQFGVRGVLAIIVIASILIAPSAAEPVSALQSPEQNCLSADEALLLDRINTVRELNGLSDLVASPTLTRAARHHADSMATYDYFPDDYTVRFDGPDHDETISWQRNIANAGYPDNTHTTRAAIIGAGTGSITTIYRTLIDLPAYQQTLGDQRFEAIGIGFASNSESAEGSYWALMFGSLVDAQIEPCDGVAELVPIESGGHTDNSSSSQLAFDGDLTTVWTSTGEDAPSSAFVWFDLGSEQDISAIEWIFAQGGAADSFAIDVSADREVWTQITRKGNGAVDEWRRLSWRGTARYVRFYFANPNADAVIGYLAEVRIYR